MKVTYSVLKITVSVASAQNITATVSDTESGTRLSVERTAILSRKITNSSESIPHGADRR